MIEKEHFNLFFNNTTFASVLKPEAEIFPIVDGNASYLSITEPKKKELIGKTIDDCFSESTKYRAVDHHILEASVKK